MNESFGEEVKRRRKAAGISQMELADLAGVSRSAIVNFESGRNGPSVRTRENILKALDSPDGTKGVEAWSGSLVVAPDSLEDINRKRLQLDLGWATLAQEAGLSKTTLHYMRNRRGISDRTVYKLEKFFGWKHGTIVTISGPVVSPKRTEAGPEPHPEVGALSEVVGQRVRDARVIAGLSQREVAEKATGSGFPLHQTQVSKIESGERPVSVDALQSLAEALGVSMVELLGGVALEARRPATEEVAERIEAQLLPYPTSLFPEDGESPEARYIAAMRHAYRTAARIARGEDQ